MNQLWMFASDRIVWSPCSGRNRRIMDSAPATGTLGSIRGQFTNGSIEIADWKRRANICPGILISILIPTRSRTIRKWRDKKNRTILRRRSRNSWALFHALSFQSFRMWTLMSTSVALRYRGQTISSDNEQSMERAINHVAPTRSKLNEQSPVMSRRN